jgi:hypothetical protein
MKTKTLKADFITITKGHDLKVILVREDKYVSFNFGSEDWIEFARMGRMDIKNQKYQNFIKDKNFKKNYKQTQDVINNSKDYKEITQTFIKDFKKDRGNKILLNETEMEVKL